MILEDFFFLGGGNNNWILFQPYYYFFNQNYLPPPYLVKINLYLRGRRGVILACSLFSTYKFKKNVDKLQRSIVFNKLNNSSQTLGSRFTNRSNYLNNKGTINLTLIAMYWLSYYMYIVLGRHFQKFFDSELIYRRFKEYRRESKLDFIDWRIT